MSGPEIPRSPTDPRQAYAAHAGAAPGSTLRREAAQRLALASDQALDWMNLAFEEFSAYRFGHGHEALARTLKLDPTFLPARWLQFQTPDTPAPASAADAGVFRARWEAGLECFERIDFTRPEARAQVWGCVGASTAFYRHYVGDAVALQTRYGRLVHRMMATLDRGEPARALRPGRRRVLFCSPYFFEHTVARLFLPLIEALDPQRFERHCLHFGSEDDAWTARARRIGGFHAGLAAPGWRQLIARLQPDAIIYLDIGMHPLPQALAALRLAPLQACLWGHPVTTGLPTLDAFLSPDAMEPDDAQSHYSERLIRLPGLGHGLEPPADATDAAADEPREDSVDVLCAQSIYKLLPEHDALFARILAQLPDTHLHMIPHPEASVRDWLRERMRPAFTAHGIDIDARVTMHAYRSLDEFRQLARRCCVNLDAIGWSGGMSSLDLLGLGLPTVTLPQSSMRSRQTAALLRSLNVPELITHDADAYVDLTVALARDASRRAMLATRIRAHLHALHDPAPVATALGRFLGQAARPE